MEQSSQMGLGFSDPQQNPEFVVIPTMVGNIPFSYEMFNPTIILDDAMVNQPDDTYTQINFVDQFLAMIDNTQKVDEIFEACKDLIFSNMVASGMNIASPDVSVTACQQESPQQVTLPLLALSQSDISIPHMQVPMDSVARHYLPFYAKWKGPTSAGSSVYNAPVNVLSTQLTTSIPLTMEVPMTSSVMQVTLFTNPVSEPINVPSAQTPC